MNIKELKRKIEEQKEKNINLFKIFQYRLHEREMQPIIVEWREGSKILKNMIKELHELETKERNNTVNTNENTKVFVNGYGEATKREITCSTYEKAQKRNSKAMLTFIGG